MDRCILQKKYISVANGDIEKFVRLFFENEILCSPELKTISGEAVANHENSIEKILKEIKDISALIGVAGLDANDNNRFSFIHFKEESDTLGFSVNLYDIEAENEAMNNYNRFVDLLRSNGFIISELESNDMMLGLELFKKPIFAVYLTSVPGMDADVCTCAFDTEAEAAAYIKTRTATLASYTGQSIAYYDDAYYIYPANAPYDLAKSLTALKECDSMISFAKEMLHFAELLKTEQDPKRVEECQLGFMDMHTELLSLVRNTKPRIYTVQDSVAMTAFFTTQLFKETGLQSKEVFAEKVTTAANQILSVYCVSDKAYCFEKSDILALLKALCKGSLRFKRLLYKWGLEIMPVKELNKHGFDSIFMTGTNVFGEPLRFIMVSAGQNDVQPVFGFTSSLVQNILADYCENAVKFNTARVEKHANLFDNLADGQTLGHEMVASCFAAGLLYGTSYEDYIEGDYKGLAPKMRKIVDDIIDELLGLSPVDEECLNTIEKLMTSDMSDLLPNKRTTWKKNS